MKTDANALCRGWAAGDPTALRYHDTEWCRPCHDDRAQFELLCLEGASVGLSWRTVLHKREAYRAAFCGFDIDACAALSDDYLQAQTQNPGLIRCRAKIFSVRQNAIAVRRIREEWGSFDRYLWSFSGGRQITGGWQSVSEMPAKSDLSDAVSADMKRRGMAYVGPVITYSFLQAIGVVNDHLAGCDCFVPCGGSL